MALLTGKNVVIIGGAGFIGHNMALQFSKLGAEVSIIDGLEVNNLLSLINSAKPNPNRDLYCDIVNRRLDLLRHANIPVYTQDARNYHKLSQLMQQIKPQVVVHLAAVAHANRSNKDPYSTFDHSLRTLENALDASRDNIEHFVYYSSSMVYGDFENGLVDEDSRCEPIGIYGALKYAGEKMVIAYNQVFDLPYTIIRPSALYGERCISGRVGQIFIEKAIKGHEISVMGDGSDKLDFTYISDLIQGTALALVDNKAKNEIFNLTYGESRSINELAEIVAHHFPELKIRNLQRDKLMPSRGTLSVEKARNLIGYDPQYPIEKGLVKYIQWYKESFSAVPEMRLLESEHLFLSQDQNGREIQNDVSVD